MGNGSPYRMTVDLNVLDHLADGLYSSVAAVLTEAVANAWDADANKVRIDLDLDSDSITIVDDGIGMDRDSMNERYLRVGYRRRTEGDRTPGNRLVMGRKGIGKLSLMSIAHLVRVRSLMEGRHPVGLDIDVSELRRAMEEEKPEYSPAPLQVDPTEFESDHGTIIEVRSLRKDRMRDVDPNSLRRRLARRFTVVGSQEFQVFVNGDEVTPADRDDLKFAEYLWVFEGTNLNMDPCDRLKEDGVFTVPNRLDTWPDEWAVTGWIGTVDRPKSLTTPEGKLNSIVVLARGRLVHEDILPRVASAEIYTKYVTGQVEAAFLDDSELSDIVTSARQSLIEGDERFDQLVALLRSTMRQIGEKWDQVRTKDKTSDLLERYPNVGTWLEGFEPGWKGKAQKLLERIATMELGDEEGEEDESRKTLLRHAILGFERLRLRGDAEELELALSRGTDALLELLSDRDTFEASLYRDIVRNRLDVIAELDKMTTDGQKEKVLQKYLFDHLWLLDAAWERATGSEAMEERLRLKEPFKPDDETKDRFGRVDIRYHTVAGKHVIVELKRASVRTGIYELAQQGAKYVDALKESLPPEERDRALIEVVFVVGRDPEEPSERVENAMNSVAPGSRIVTYDLLITRAKQAYESYLAGTQQADRVDRILLEARHDE